MLDSSICTQEQLESAAFRGWVAETGEPFRLHRKCWEFAYISQALHERGLLAPGRRGLGFGVGREPLASMYARRGCEVVATDQAAERAVGSGWMETGQLMSTLDDLNERRICDPWLFRRNVSQRVVDMNAIPADLRGFDFTYSSCCFEHLGSIEQGLRFIEAQMACLRPGGVAVHTTELNVSSEVETLESPFISLFRRDDFRRLAARLTARGHHVALDFTPGKLVADNHVDLPPYAGPHSLRIAWDRYVTTSFGLIVTKDARRFSPRRLGSLLRRAG